MADAAAVISSAIEKLDSLLLQKADRRNDHARLCSLRLEKKDLVVGMVEVWENDNEMLYSLLVGVVDLWNVKEKKVDRDKVCSFVGEMEDLWELNCWEKLHSLLLQMMDLYFNREKLFSFEVEKLDLYYNREKLLSLAVEMADLWEDSKGKLNKEKLYTWLSEKTDLWEEEELFRLLEDIPFLERPKERMVRLMRPKERMELLEGDCTYMEGVRNDLRFILNKLEDQDHLHYFMSDVVEMAHDVQLLLHLKDSDPYILFFQIFNLYVVNTLCFSASFLRFFSGIKPIHERLQETKKRVRKFGADETSQINNVRDEFGQDHHVVGLEEDVELLLRNAETTIRIQGMAGIGKTTLAREFYNHPEIVGGFECRAWVCLSSWKLSRNELLIELIRQFIDSSERDDMVIEKMENKALQQMLRQHLQDKPYVLVLDDVSEKTYLQYVFQTLP